MTFSPAPRRHVAIEFLAVQGRDRVPNDQGSRELEPLARHRWEGQRNGHCPKTDGA